VASVERAIDLITQYDNTFARYLRASLSHAASPEAAARFVEHVVERKALIALVWVGMEASEARVDVEPSTQDLNVDTVTFGTVTEL
jgi:hypothetical protein